MTTSVRGLSLPIIKEESNTIEEPVVPISSGTLGGMIRDCSVNESSDLTRKIQTKTIGVLAQSSSIQTSTPSSFKASLTTGLSIPSKPIKIKTSFSAPLFSILEQEKTSPMIEFSTMGSSSSASSCSSVSSAKLSTSLTSLTISLSPPVLEPRLDSMKAGFGSISSLKLSLDIEELSDATEGLKPHTLLEFSINRIDIASVKICIKKIDKTQLTIQHQTLNETFIKYNGVHYKFSTSKLGYYHIINHPKFCVICPDGIIKSLLPRTYTPKGSSGKTFEL